MKTVQDVLDYLQVECSKLDNGLACDRRLARNLGVTKTSIKEKIKMVCLMKSQIRFITHAINEAEK